jgi:hypothetical protein
MNKKNIDEKRADLRFHSENGIAYSFFNKAEQYAGIAKDVSRDGMYFLSRRHLKPGTVVCIQPLECKSATLYWENGHDRHLANDLCTATSSSASTRKFFAHIVTAEVKRCQVVDETTTWRYGVGVNFLRPTV